jgi:putative membrane protein
MNRTIKDYFIILLKGIAMGAADVVPGVSGGTIAFISGIYQELIDTINKINLKALKILKSEGIITAFHYVNGSFLVSLLLGIAISVISLARLFKYLLEEYPIFVWSFFFGLVLASILFVGKQIKKWNFSIIMALIIGAFIAFYITTLPASTNQTESWFLIIAGALAICAMILPGISGAFILLLLGAYKPVLDAIHHFDIKKIALIGIGAIVGILSFAKVLKWLFRHQKNITLAVLTGFILGSLNKIWPWKKVLQSEMIEGKLKILHEKSISPFNYPDSNHLFYAILLAIIGFLVIVILEKLGNKA